jgi:hypothetical protein
MAVERLKVEVSAEPSEEKPKLTTKDMELLVKDQETKAKYKIEVIFSRHRSSLLHKVSPCMVIMWESGKRFHGGGDQKLYWCGHPDCEKPLSSDNFAYMHAVCPSCQRECFLDPDSKNLHVEALRREGKDDRGMRGLPYVIGERMVALTPPKLAELLERVWRSLEGDADIYLKYSPFEIRYDILHETSADIDNLDKVRVQRQPLIYTLKNILKDLSAGAELRKRILAMITS